MLEEEEDGEKRDHHSNQQQKGHTQPYREPKMPTVEAPDCHVRHPVTPPPVCLQKYSSPADLSTLATLQERGKSNRASARRYVLGAQAISA